jgi:PadR family transcriptional regulator PadR
MARFFSQAALGPLEIQILQTLLERPGDHFGLAIMQRIEKRTGRVRSFGGIYSCLGRLERKGLVSSWWGDPTATRGGRRKRLYKIEASGAEAFRRCDSEM